MTAGDDDGTWPECLGERESTRGVGEVFPPICGLLCVLVCMWAAGGFPLVPATVPAGCPRCGRSISDRLLHHFKSK